MQDLSTLSKTERQVYQHLISNLTELEIAKLRKRALSTIRTQSQSIRDKLGIRNRAEIKLHGLIRRIELLERWIRVNALQVPE